MRRAVLNVSWIAAVAAHGCTDRTAVVDSAGGDDTTTSAPTSTSTTTSGASADATTTPADTTTTDDGSDTTGGTPDCPVGDEHCMLLDVLFVVDNSGTMAQEQAHVAASFGPMVDALAGLTDSGGVAVKASVNVMVTTTDVGHPLCTPLQKPDYAPSLGAPVSTGCNARIARFTGLGDDPAVVETACTDVCPVDVVPTDPFVHFDSAGTNVPGGTPAQALACLGPQGIDGCEYESPLEAMLLALDPAACWNDPGSPACADDPTRGERPFLRDGSTIVIVMITDDAECSVAAPDGFSYFTDPQNAEYWEVSPSSGQPEASPAVCWNAGVSCDGPDAGGEYTGCVSTDEGVLHPTSRYVDALAAMHDAGHDVVMLGALGVPPVTSHNPFPPFEPIAGGVFALSPRVWTDADLTPAEVAAGVTVADKVWENGDIAPGCASERASAIFPTRVQEVCEALDVPDDPATPEIEDRVVRCCIESLCDVDFTHAVRCLTPSVIVGPPKG